MEKHNGKTKKLVHATKNSYSHVKRAKEKRNNYGVHVKKENWKQWSEKEMRKF
jgi:hypothetical protein